MLADVAPRCIYLILKCKNTPTLPSLASVFAGAFVHIRGFFFFCFFSFLWERNKRATGGSGVEPKNVIPSDMPRSSLIAGLSASERQTAIRRADGRSGEISGAAVFLKHIIYSGPYLRISFLVYLRPASPAQRTAGPGRCAASGSQTY